ncbi:MAG: transcription elongation factor GreA [Patescibacteria group bacterium]
MEAEYLTRDKFNELETELTKLKTTRRKEIAEALEYAKSLGDLSENQEYQEARDSQAILEDRIKHLEHVIRTASIVSSQNTNMVSVGSLITVEKGADKSKKSYTIVGSEEANAALGKISTRSPLGVGAMGKKKGDSFSFDTPSGIMSYKIIDIK